MIDAAIRQYIDPPLNSAGAKIAAVGVSANTVTIVGFFLGMTAIPFIVSGNFLVALVFILLNRLFDGLDGAVARQTILSDFGGYLDIVSDFIFYSGIVFAFAWASPENTLVAAFLIFSFMGTASTFLAYAAMAAKHDISTDIRGIKSLYYLGGLAEGAETIAVFILFCLVPEFFSIIALVFAVMCWITTATRIYAAYVTFKE